MVSIFDSSLKFKAKTVFHLLNSGFRNIMYRLIPVTILYNERNYPIIILFSKIKVGFQFLFSGESVGHNYPMTEHHTCLSFLLTLVMSFVQERRIKIIIAVTVVEVVVCFKHRKIKIFCKVSRKRGLPCASNATNQIQSLIH